MIIFDYMFNINDYHATYPEFFVPRQIKLYLIKVQQK